MPIMRKLFYLALLLPPLLFYTAYSDKSEDPEQSVESFMEDVRIINRINGKRQWSLETAKATFTEENARMSGVGLDLPEEDMKVTAERGIYDMQTGDLKLSGNVRAFTESYVVKTGSLDLDSGSIEVTTDEKVLIESRSFRIEGRGFSARRKEVRLSNDVHAEFF